ncbi:MAG: PKD domain-containing protein [Anaerolineae bacterium]|jgi:uncharacterized repeat protein (TIGR01451 family)
MPPRIRRDPHLLPLLLHTLVILALSLALIVPSFAEGDPADPPPPVEEPTPTPVVEIVLGTPPDAAPMPEGEVGPAGTGTFPDCGFNCTANDVVGSNLRLAKGETNDTPLEPCTPGEPSTAWIWITLTNTQNSSRYEVTVVGDLYVDGVFHSHIEHCALDSIGDKAVVNTSLTSFEWTCGARVELRNLLVAWTAGGGGACPNPTSCTEYQASKCYMQAVAPIAAPLVADFTFDNVCLSDGTVDFVDDTTGGEMPYTYAWDFGDGGTSTSQSPSHTYAAAGSYEVTLTVTDAQAPPVQDSQTHTVNVWEGPTAAFTASPMTGDVPLEVTFTDTSTKGDEDIVSWAWDFDDGGTSTSQNPTHTFTDAGTYSVELTVTDEGGCEDSVTHDIVVACSASIEVTKSTDFEGLATLGDVIDYTIEVDNTGPVGVEDLMVTDEMLGTLTYESGDNNEDEVLDPDETWVYSGSYEVTVEDICWTGLLNTASAEGVATCGAQVEDDSDEVTVGMTYHAELTVDKTTTLVGKAKSGDTVQYAIKVTNTGNVTLYDVTVTDLMLGIVADTSIGDLAPDGSETIYGSYKVQSGDKGKSLTNTAVATALDPCEKEVRAEDSVTIEVSKPSVKKPTPVPPTPVPTPPLPPVLPPTGAADAGAGALPWVAGLGSLFTVAVAMLRRRR